MTREVAAERWQRWVVVASLTTVAGYGVASLLGAASHAAVLAGTEPMGPLALVGVAYVVLRLSTLIVVPVGLLAVLLSWTMSCLLRRYVPSAPQDG